MAFLKRLLCCGAAGKVKYDDDSHARRKNAREKVHRTPRRKLKAGAKTAPASGVDERTASNAGPESTRSSRVANVVIEESPCSPTPPGSRHKSYSSVSSVGRKLVEKLADEVVEDFMEYDLMDPCAESRGGSGGGSQEKPKPQQQQQPQPQTQQGRIHFTTQADTSVIADTRGTVHQQQQQFENKATRLEDTHDLVDSAWETQERSFMQKRAFFESQTSSTALAKNLTIKKTENMKPSTMASDREEEEEAEQEEELFQEDFVQTDVAAGHQRQWNQPQPLRMSDRGMEMCNNSKFNKSLSHVQSGRSWVLEVDVDDSLDPAPPITPSSALDDREDDLSCCMEMEKDEMRFFKETCVVRKVFRAASIADDEVESSDDDGSVISLEVTSCPSEGNEECHDGRALEWGYTMNLRRERTPAAEINSIK